MSTEALEELVRTAEDEGKEVFIQWHPEYSVIDYVEIEGVEIENEDYEDEVNDQYWVEDSYRVAERSWRE